eukprot:232999-Rhodomonas_salina.1
MASVTSETQMRYWGAIASRYREISPVKSTVQGVATKSDFPVSAYPGVPGYRGTLVPGYPGTWVSF